MTNRERKRIEAMVKAVAPGILSREKIIRIDGPKYEKQRFSTCKKIVDIAQQLIERIDALE